jgi:hypothetical protein
MKVLDKNDPLTTVSNKTQAMGLLSNDSNECENVVKERTCLRDALQQEYTQIFGEHEDQSQRKKDERAIVGLRHIRTSAA